MLFSHYILTRYNVGLYSDNPYGVNGKDEWMAGRITWFERTAASVKAQMCQKFLWLVIVDPWTPDTFLKEIDDLLPENANLVTASDLFLGDLNMLWPREGDLLTSRVDNDDILLPGYVETVQAHVGEHAEGIDTLGWVRDYATGEVRVPVWDGRPVSMFLSLHETRRPFRTVCAWEHPHLHKLFPTKMIPERLWEITIHDNNLKNHVNS